MAEPLRKQIIKDMINGLETLPDERLEEIHDFVQFLRHKTVPPHCGSPDALLRAFGSWEGAPWELDRLVGEIYETRHQEEKLDSYLLDTNHVSKVLDGHQLLRQRLLAAQQRGDLVGISTTYSVGSKGPCR